MLCISIHNLWLFIYLFTIYIFQLVNNGIQLLYDQSAWLWTCCFSSSQITQSETIFKAGISKCYYYLQQIFVQLLCSSVSQWQWVRSKMVKPGAAFCCRWDVKVFIFIIIIINIKKNIYLCSCLLALLKWTGLCTQQISLISETRYKKKLHITHVPLVFNFSVCVGLVMIICDSTVWTPLSRTLFFFFLINISAMCFQNILGSCTRYHASVFPLTCILHVPYSSNVARHQWFKLILQR